MKCKCKEEMSFCGIMKNNSTVYYCRDCGIMAILSDDERDDNEPDWFEKKVSKKEERTCSNCTYFEESQGIKSGLCKNEFNKAESNLTTYLIVFKDSCCANHYFKMNI